MITPSVARVFCATVFAVPFPRAVTFTKNVAGFLPPPPPHAPPAPPPPRPALPPPPPHSPPSPPTRPHHGGARPRRRAAAVGDLRPAPGADLIFDPSPTQAHPDPQSGPRSDRLDRR